MQEKLILHNRKNFHLNPCIFLDRDGVIIEDVHYIKDPALVRLCPGVPDFFELLHAYKIPAVIVTNQSGITRGYSNWSDYHAVTERMLSLLGYPKQLIGIYANGYGPNTNDRGWRKPNPQMLLEASKDLHLDLQRSAIIGDRATDLEAGINAGINMVIQLLTGHGRNEINKVKNILATIDKKQNMSMPLKDKKDLKFIRYETMHELCREFENSLSSYFY